MPLFIMIDAMGFEILSRYRFCNDLLPVRKRLNSVFGYSSACVPSILSGRWPDEHYNWCYFVYDPQNSPFHWLESFRWLPRALTSRRIFRRRLSQAVQQVMKFEGYFDLYNMPFEHLHLFDFSERKSPLQPGGMNKGANIFDLLVQNQARYFVSNPHRPEEENFQVLQQQLREGTIDFAFMYWANLDGLLHRVGNESKEVQPLLDIYERWIQQLVEAAKSRYGDVELYVFSDHGMANCTKLVNLKGRIDALNLRFGEDYVAVYDSTMARFWFLKPGARPAIEEELAKEPLGRILPDYELKSLRAYFPDHRFGELIFLLKEGTLIVPSHMGERPITAMHGYHPTETQSYASLLTNQPAIPENITAIPHIYNLMAQSINAA
jgi:predicted AlkP superfamily pyrophosphatase or phosphodiesterase